MFNNDETEREGPDEDNPTEFVMKKEGEYLHVWAVVDGEEVFHAAPHVQGCKGPIQAGVQTFLSRAFQQEIIDMATDDNDSKGVF